MEHTCIFTIPIQLSCKSSGTDNAYSHDEYNTKTVKIGNPLQNFMEKLIDAIL